MNKIKRFIENIKIRLKYGYSPKEYCKRQVVVLVDEKNRLFRWGDNEKFVVRAEDMFEKVKK